MKQKGFTLIENMVVVAILAILVSLAAPDYSGYVQSGKVNTTADMINQQLGFAKFDALRSHKTVYLTIKDNSFCLSTSASPNDNCDIRKDLMTSSIILTLVDSSSGASLSSISFDSIYGMPSNQVNFTVKSTNGKGKTVSINGIGLVKTQVAL